MRCLKDFSRNINENSSAALPTFKQKVGNQAGNISNMVGNIIKYQKYNELQQSVKWIKANEGGQLLNIPKRTIKYHCKQGHFVTRRVKMNGGMGYEISVESMFRYYESLGDWKKCERILELLRGVEEEVPRDGELATSEALAKYQIVKMFDAIQMHAKRKTTAAERFVASFNNGAYPELKAVVGEISLRSIYRWKQVLRENNYSVAALDRELKPAVTTVSNREASILIPMCLNPNRPLVSEILKAAKEEFLKDGIALKSDVTYRRFIQEWTSRNIDLWTLGRYGMKAFNDKILKDILRDKDCIEVGDILVADGHTMNVFVINPLTGRPQRMTLIMFYDFKSDMPVGWEIMPTENVQTIASALRNAILRLGRFFDAEGFVPRVVYLDNGRAFRAKYFRGVKDFQDSLLPGLFGKLGIEVMYATPYHGQSKTIERWFKTLGELERRLPAYTGTDTHGKPAMLMRNEKLHQRLFENTPVTIESLAASLEEFIKEYAEQPHQDGQYKGLCPAEVFMHSVKKVKSEGKHLKRCISKRELIYLMLSDETRTIGKNGIRFRGTYYWNEEMPRMIGSSVVIKYDLWNDSEIIVLDERGRLLFSASKDDVRYHPAARLLGTDDDVALLQEALRRKNQQKNETVAIFKQIVALNQQEHPKQIEQPKQAPRLSDAERKRRAMKEYMALIGYKPFANPVEEHLKKA